MTSKTSSGKIYSKTIAGVCSYITFNNKVFKVTKVLKMTEGNN